MSVKPPGQVYKVPLPEVSVQFDTGAFDHRIAAHGVPLVHYRAMRSPGGMTDLHDIRSPEGDNLGSSNGFLYTHAGVIMALFTSNNMHTNIADVGLMDGSNVQVTTARFYIKEHPDDPDVRAYVLPFDRFYLDSPNIVVPNWQLVECHATGIDRLQYPATSVQDLVDASGIRYAEGVDFRLHDGQIAWKPGHGPGDRVDLSRGVIYSIRYLYRPYFYVKGLGHELRVAAAPNPLTGEKYPEQMPQAFTLQREYLFEDSQSTPDSEYPDNPRQQRGPADGGFGPR